MLINDLVKIRLVDMGYLPNYPYHLISDNEMCKAFMDCTTGLQDDPESVGTGMFFDYYPLLDSSQAEIYSQLVLTIQYYLLVQKYTTDRSFVIPDWIFSYMINAVISVNSSKLDIHDLILPLGVDNIDDDFNAECAMACYRVSSLWVTQSQSSKLISIPEELADDILSDMSLMYVCGRSLSSIYADNENKINTRPPTLYGDPDVVRYIRLQQAMGR